MSEQRQWCVRLTFHLSNGALPREWTRQLRQRLAAASMNATVRRSNRKVTLTVLLTGPEHGGEAAMTLFTACEELRLRLGGLTLTIEQAS